MKRKYGILGVLVLLLALCLGVPSATAQAKVKSGTQMRAGRAGTFVKSKNKWRYWYKDGIYAKDCLLRIKGKIYYFSPRGYRMCGWQKSGKLLCWGGTDKKRKDLYLRGAGLLHRGIPLGGLQDIADLCLWRTLNCYNL